jgi:putative nucleotidyltransferase with HDIG domain
MLHKPAPRTAPRSHIAVVSDRAPQRAELTSILGEIGPIRRWLPGSAPEDVTRTAACAVIDVDLDSPDPGRGMDLVRSFTEKSAIPIICVLDHSAEQQELNLRVAQIRALGAAAISRPFTPEDLLEAVRSKDDQAFERKAVERGGAVGLGVSVAHGMLTNIFRASRGGRPVPFDQVKVKDVIIIDALRTSGIKAWLDLVRQHHNPTYRHSLLVTGVAVAFAQALDMRIEDQQRLARAGLLHNIGNALLPLDILENPDVLTEQETAEIRKHPVLGYELLVREGGFPEEILACVRHHHEFLDGSGYPDGLGGHQIPDLVRIVTIADVFCTLSEQHANKSSLAVGRTLGVMESMIGKLDGDLLRAFRTIAWDPA